MKAVRFHGVGDLRTEEIPDPTPGPDDVLITVEAAGMCASDIHIIDGHYASNPVMTLGHEFSGRITAVGNNVEKSRIGDLVTVEPHEYDRTCMYCHVGLEHMCLNKRAYGVQLDGGMAEYAAIPARLAYSVPEGVPAVHAAMTEPIACSVHAMDRLAPVSGLPIAVHGCGPAGAILTGLARMQGLAPIVVIDPKPDRRDLALRVGADLTLDPLAGDFDERVLEVTNGYGFPYQIEASGSAAVVETAVGIAARHGTVLLFGVAAPDATATIRPQEIYAKELSLLGTAINPFTHHRAVQLLSRLPLSELRLAEFSIDHVDEAFAAQRSAAADKVFIIPGGTP